MCLSSMDESGAKISDGFWTTQDIETDFYYAVTVFWNSLLTRRGSTEARARQTKELGKDQPGGVWKT